MSLVETIGEIVGEKQQGGEHVLLTPTALLQKTLDQSEILDSFEKLSALQIRIEKELIENGGKMVIDARWGNADTAHRLVVSATETSISFIGNYANNQYIRLERKGLDKHKSYQALIKTFSNPQSYNAKG